ncbi:MAG TPA: competence/damage-inducible protein A [Bacteroidia bacterium]|jgi:nicotinamide-nucleotide amidase|nr:competence/damage-inducible protein A [Bacteroidia bacterium]
MNAEIITIGDEILIGQIVDTNSAWMAQELNKIGVFVKQITSVSDQKEHILKALDEARGRAGIILLTGGLGPTRDDITKNTLCEYFNVSMVFNKEVYADVEAIFARFGKTVSAVNKLQAEIPSNATPLHNLQGTAPGMWFEEKGHLFVSMPGVPYEMKGLMIHEVLPRIKAKYTLPYILHRTILTQGIGESDLADRISGWEDSLAPHRIKLAYLPAPNKVRLRMTVSGTDQKELERIVVRKEEELRILIAPFIYGADDETLQTLIGHELKKRGEKLGLAESCTGGYISHLITQIPGCSDYYEGSVITYSYAQKERLLGVKRKTLDQFGAVSQEVVEEMVLGALDALKVDHAIAVSGIAGPSGGTPDKPVGTVWIGIASGGKVHSKRFQFGHNRERNIEASSEAALHMLHKALLPAQ